MYLTLQKHVHKPNAQRASDEGKYISAIHPWINAEAGAGDTLMPGVKEDTIGLKLRDLHKDINKWV